MRTSSERWSRSGAGQPRQALFVRGGDPEGGHVVVGLAHDGQARGHTVAGKPRRNAEYRAPAGDVERHRHHDIEPALDALTIHIDEIAGVVFGVQGRDGERRADQRVVLFEQLTERNVELNFQRQPR